MIIYKITNQANGKSYIGLTKGSIADRWVQHCYDAGARTTNQAIHRAIRKYGVENFTIKHIASATCWEDLIELEKILIAQHGTYGTQYNMTLGGEGIQGHKFTAKSRAKIGAKSKGRKHDAASRAKISTGLQRAYAEGRRSRTITESQRQAVIASNQRRCVKVMVGEMLFHSRKAAEAEFGQYQLDLMLQSGEAVHVSEH